MSEAQNIQWFPGHMTKTRRKIEAQMGLIDAVAEIVDARIPVSSRNPDLAGILSGKPLIILFNKCDMADPVVTADWIRYYESKNIKVLPVDCKSGKGLQQFEPSVKELLKDKIARNAEKGMAGKPLRLMIVGIPNVGKSSFINRLTKGAKAKVENRPGVTRGNQWFSIGKQLELLDTPGILWPKFDDKTIGEHLAFTGAVNDRVVDVEWLAMRLAELLAAEYPEALSNRYGALDFSVDSYELLCEIGKKRGMMIRGGEVNTERAANMLLEEFRSGKLGRITLERIPDHA
ncbi:MAG: ribosome biogenesis GTPase YlqF [Clostridia bacterium]|nr:ribosome biogenesis GTPase YlqF [Clostridia bacterium]